METYTDKWKKENEDHEGEEGYPIPYKPVEYKPTAVILPYPNQPTLPEEPIYKSHRPIVIPPINEDKSISWNHNDRNYDDFNKWMNENNFKAAFSTKKESNNSKTIYYSALVIRGPNNNWEFFIEVRTLEI